MDDPGVLDDANAGDWVLAQLLDDDDMDDFFMLMLEYEADGYDSDDAMKNMGWI